MYKTDSLNVSSGYVNVLCVVLPLLSYVTKCPKTIAHLSANYRVHAGLVPCNSDCLTNSLGVSFVWVESLSYKNVGSSVGGTVS